jgi:hypoxanthine phosphoribosyltransferase
MVELIRPSWREIASYSKQLCKRIKKEYRPEVLIGISRGGLVPVRLFSDYLDNHTVGIIRVVFYKGINEREKEPKIEQPLSLDIRDKRVLLVDDVADTGHSLKVAIEYIKSLGPKEVKVACIHYKPNSIFKPEYYAEETDKWIDYPWEHEETKKKLKALRE